MKNQINCVPVAADDPSAACQVISEIFEQAKLKSAQL